MGPQVFFGKPGSSVALVVLFWALFYLWIGSEMFLSWKLRAPKGSGSVDDDAGSKWILIISTWVGVVVGFLLAVLLPSAAFMIDRLALFVIGLVLMLTGMAFRWYSIRVLGQSFTFSVATRPDQPVVETGPYRWIRHPSYTGSLITVLGVLLCLTNPLSLLALALPLAGYAYRIRIEERLLARQLGDPYRSYMRRTKRLIPFLV